MSIIKVAGLVLLMLGVALTIFMRPNDVKIDDLFEGYDLVYNGGRITRKKTNPLFKALILIGLILVLIGMFL